MVDYYVDGAVGNDGNLGTSEGAGNAWATIQHAANTVVAGDTVYIKASATYNEQVTLTTVGASGAGNQIIYEGYLSTPGDNGRATIDGQSLRTNCVDITLSNAYHEFKNLNFVNAAGDNFDGAGTVDLCMFFNCRFANAGQDNISGDNSLTFVHCEFSNAGNQNVDVDNSCWFVFCKFINGSITDLGVDQAYRCVFSGYADGTQMINNGSTLIENTFDRQGSVQDIVDASLAIMCVGNIFHDAAGIAVENTVSNVHYFQGYNLFSSVNTKYFQLSNSIAGTLDIDAPANFTDEAGGDYTLQSISAAVDAGGSPGLLT